MKLLRSIFFFGLVGFVGFFLDTAVLYLLLGALGPFYARIISFLVAVFSTWAINRKLTFGERNSGLSARREFIAYFSLMLVGGVINFGIYALLIVKYEFVLIHPVVGVAAGSIGGMAINFVSSRFLLYRFNIRH